MFVIRNLLAVDTTFKVCSVALRYKDSSNKVITTSRTKQVGLGHAEHLIGMIENIIVDARIALAELDALAVAIGPGSYTGIKVGVAAIRGLALATGLPIYTASSLAVVSRCNYAQLQPSRSFDYSLPTLVCINARRDQIYFQILSGATQKALTSPQIGSIDDAVNKVLTLYDKIMVVLPSDLNIAKALIAKGVMVETEHEAALPSAEYLLDVDLTLANKPSPLYLRPPDAKPQSRKVVVHF